MQNAMWLKYFMDFFTNFMNAFTNIKSLIARNISSLKKSGKNKMQIHNDFDLFIVKIWIVQIRTIKLSA